MALNFIQNLMNENMINNDFTLDLLYILDSEKYTKNELIKIYGDLQHTLEDYLLMCEENNLILKDSIKLSPYGKNILYLYGIRKNWVVDSENLNCKSELFKLIKSNNKDIKSNNKDIKSNIIERKFLEKYKKHEIENALLELSLDGIFEGYLNPTNDIVVKNFYDRVPRGVTTNPVKMRPKHQVIQPIALDNLSGRETLPSRLVLTYDEEKDNFDEWPQETDIQLGIHTYLIIDETQGKMTVSYKDGISIISKRTIERRVNSYSKSGFNMGNKRVGLGFPLEEVNAEEQINPDLLTHGHTYKKGRLVRDDIPAYAEKGANYDVVTSIDGQKSVPPPKQTASTPEVIVELDAASSPVQSSDDALWALGQFVDQFARQGKICMVTYEGPGRFRLVTLKDRKFKTPSNNVNGIFRIDNVNLFEL